MGNQDDDKDFLYHTYRMMNFSLLPPRMQLEYFYIREFRCVTSDEHYQFEDRDCEYNPNIINPVYQLFVSTFWFSQGLMDLVEELHGQVGDMAISINELREDLFDKDIIGPLFYSGIENNTSITGFLHSECWKELRTRVKIILKFADLLDNLVYQKPIKFRGFLYPDDFHKYEPHPYWSAFGQFVTIDEWNSLKSQVMESYKGAIINCE